MPESEAAKEVPHFLLAHVRRGTVHELERSAVKVELLDPVLREVADPRPGRVRERPVQRRQPPRQSAQQGRLSHPVRPQQGDAVSGRERHRDVAQHRAITVTERHRFQRRRGPGRTLGLEELEGEPLLRVEWLDHLHPFERLEPALRLPRLARLVAEPVDERLDSRPLAMETCRRAARMLQLDGAEPFERAVVPGMDQDASVTDQRDVIDDRVEKFPVVGDQQERSGVAPQPGLEPDDRIEVEMVGRLVEQEKLRGRGERSGKRGPHSPATGERVQRPRLIPGSESESTQDPARLRLRAIAVDGLQVRMGGCLPAGVAAGLGIREPGTNRGDARIAARHVVDEGDFARGGFLGDGRGRDAGGQLDVAAIGFELSEKQAEEAGLAGAVRSDHTDLLPALDHEARAIEHLDATAAKLDVVQANHRAGPWRRPVAPPVDMGDGSEFDSMHGPPDPAPHVAAQGPAASRTRRVSGIRSLLPANARSSHRCTSPMSELYAVRSSRRYSLPSRIDAAAR